MVGYVIKDKLKKAFSIMVIIITFAFMLVLVTGCEKENENDKPQQEVVKKTYTVTFDSTGGSLVESQTVTEGETLTKPTTPTKEGYEFLGWTYNGENYLFSSPVSSDMTLVATWAEKEQVWVVTLDLDDGSLTKKVNVKKGEKLEKPETPAREGYDFVSWQLDGKDYDFNKVVEKDITLKATWKEKKLKITFDTKGGTAVAAQEISINGVVKAPKEPTKNGWTFVEWQFEGKKYDFKEEVKTNMTLVAKWKLTQTYQKEESVTKKLNGKNVKIDFRYVNKNDKEEVDVFVNDIKALTTIAYFDEEGCNMSDYAWCVENKSELLSGAQAMVSHIKEEIKIIKVDKEYLTIKSYGDDGYKIAIVSDSGSILHNDSFADMYVTAGFVLEKSCPNYDKFVVGDDEVQKYYSILNDGIYYLKKTAAYQISEYKTTISNNKTVTTKVATCLGWTSNQGGNVDEFSYIITKTKKVNNKNVNLEYRFIIDDNAELFSNDDSTFIYANLYIDNKLVLDRVFGQHDFASIKENYKKMTNLDDDANMTFASNYWKEVETKLDKQFGVIKGDKEYLFVKSYSASPTGDSSRIYVFNSSNKEIFSSTIVLGGGGMNIDKLCPNLNLFTNNTGDTLHLDNRTVISNNKIYYFKSGKISDLNLEEHQEYFEEAEIEAFDQYQVEFKNDKAVETKLATCAGYHEGAIE